MTTTPMSLSRFRELARAYGSDLSRWPEAEQAGARALVESSTDARAVLDAERPLDAVFASFEEPRMSDLLTARLARLPDRPVARPLRIPRRAWRAPAVGWAAAALFGLWLGTQSAEAEEAENSAAAVAASTIDGDSPELVSGTDGGDPSDSGVVQLANGALENWEEFE